MHAVYRSTVAVCVMSGLTLSGLMSIPDASAQPTVFNWTDGDPTTNNYTAAGNWGNFFTDSDPTPNNFDETARFGSSTSSNQTVTFNASNISLGRLEIVGSRNFTFNGSGRLTIDDGIFNTALVTQAFSNPISTRSTSSGTSIFSNRPSSPGATGAIQFFNFVTVNQDLRLFPNPVGGVLDFRSPVVGGGDVFLEPGDATGNGRVIFRGDNGFEDLGIGAFTTVELRGGGRLDRDTDVSIARDGTLAMFGMADAINGLNGQGTVQLNDGATLVIGNYDGFGSVGTGTFEGTIEGNGSLVKRGRNGTFTLSGERTFTGTTLVEEGTLRLEDFGASASRSTSPITVLASAQLQADGSPSVPITIRGGGLLSTYDRRSPRFGGPVTLDDGAIVTINMGNTLGTNASMQFDRAIDLTDTTLRVMLPSDTESISFDHRTIFDFDGGRTGEFSTVEFVNVPDQYESELLYTTTGADVLFSLIGAGLAGDFTGNGSVEQSDLDLVLTGWGTARGNWSNADAFATANVDQEELDMVLTNWGASSAPSFAANPNVVPEPGVLGWLVVGFGAMLRRRASRVG